MCIWPNKPTLRMLRMYSRTVTGNFAQCIVHVLSSAYLKREILPVLYISLHFTKHALWITFRCSQQRKLTSPKCINLQVHIWHWCMAERHNAASPVYTTVKLGNAWSRFKPNLPLSFLLSTYFWNNVVNSLYE